MAMNAVMLSDGGGVINPYADAYVEEKETFRIIPHTSENLEFGDAFFGKTDDGIFRQISDSGMREYHNMIAKSWDRTGIYDHHVLDSFNRFYQIFPDFEMPQDLKSYIFITRPEMNLINRSSWYRGNKSGGLNLVTENSGDARLRQLAVMYPELVQMLTKGYSIQHDFMPYISSRAESMQLPDYQIRTSDFTIPFYNYKFTYPTVTNESETGGSFDITFREDSELRITNLFQFWVYYMNAVMKGKMFVDDEHKYENYYDFMCSVYEIVCDPTSERILYYSKYTGCYPTGVPTSQMSHNLRSGTENHLNITFNYIRVEHLDPAILLDFNDNCNPSGEIEPIYDETFGMTGPTLVSAPKIVFNNAKNALLLQWVAKEDSGPSATLPSSVATYNNFMQADNSAAYVANAVNNTGSSLSTTYSTPGSGRVKNVTGPALSSYTMNRTGKIVY